jgi:hypothetical protein
MGYTNKAELMTLIGDARREDRDYESAIEAYDRCLGQWPGHTPAVDGKAQALLALQRYDDVIQLCEAAIDLNPTATRYFLRLAVALWHRHHEGDRERAMAELETARALGPRDTRLYMTEASFRYQEGLTMLREGKPKQARGHFGRAIEVLLSCLRLAPPGFRPAIRNRLANLYLHTGEVDLAVAQTEQGLGENPDYVQNYMAHAMVLLAAKRWHEAAEVASRGCNHPRGGPGGRIWCSLFSILGCALRGDTLEGLSAEMARYAAERGQASWFDPSAWEWDAARDRVKEQIAALGPPRAPVLGALLELHEGRLPTQEFLRLLEAARATA